jgi:hypothetical protein
MQVNGINVCGKLQVTKNAMVRTLSRYEIQGKVVLRLQTMHQD